MKKSLENIITKLEHSIFASVGEKIRLSYLYLLSEYASLNRVEELPEFFPSEVFNDFLSYLENDIICLKETINSTTDDKLDAAKRCDEWKKKISEMYLHVSLYENQCMLNEFICLNYQLQAKSSSAAIGRNTRSDSMNKCFKYIEEFTGRDINERISKLISAIPIKMTREKYYDYVRISLKNQCNTHSRLTHVFIEDFKRKFYPTAYPGYGNVFGGIAEALSNIMSEEMPDMNSGLSDKIIYDTIEDVCGSLDEVGNSIYAIQMLLESMFRCCSHMQALLLYMPNWDEFFVNDLLLADLYYSIRENVNSELKDEFLERVAEITTQNMNYDSLIKMENDIFTTLQTNKDILDNSPDNSIENMLLILENITDLFAPDIKMNSYNFVADIPDEDKPLSYAEIEAVVDETVNYIKDVCSGFSQKYTKIIRQFSFTALTVYESADKLLDYIKNCLQDGDSKYINYFDMMMDHLLFTERFYLDDNYDMDEEFNYDEDKFHYNHHVHHDGCCDHDHH